MPRKVESKMKKKKVIIGVVVAAVVLALVAGGYFVVRAVTRTPQARLLSGIRQFAEECAEYQNPSLAEIDPMELAKESRTTPYSTFAELNIVMPELGMYDTFGIDVLTNYDYGNKMGQVQMDLSMMNISFLKADIVIADDDIYMSVPDLLDGAYFINSKTLTQDYNNSVLREWMGTETLDESFSFDFFVEEDDEEDSFSDTEISRLIAELWDTMTVQESSSKLEREQGSKTMKYDGVEVVLDKDVLNDILKECEVYDLYYFAKDVELIFYLDKKDRIVQIATDSKIKLENDCKIRFALDFMGKERTPDEVSGTIEVEIDGQELIVEVEHAAELSKDSFESILTVTAPQIECGIEMESGWDEDDFYLDITLDDSVVEYNLELEGYVEAENPKESYTVHIGKLAFTEAGEERWSMSGEVGAYPFEGEIEEPESAKEFFALNQMELLEILMEVQNKLSTVR